MEQTTSTKATEYGKTFRTDYPSVREVTKNGRYRYYLIDCRNKDWKGKPFEQRTTKEAALIRAREIADLIQKNGIKGVVHDLEMQEFRNTKNRLAPFSRTIHEVVEEWILLCSTNNLNAASRRTNDVVKEWEAMKLQNNLKPLAKKTRMGIEATTRQLIKAFSDIPIKSVTKEMVNDVLSGYRNTVSAFTVNVYRKNFRSVFEWATTEKEYLKKNPCNGIKVSVPEREIKILDIGSVETLASRLVNDDKHKPLQPYIALCLWGGLRPNEAAQIKWSDINFTTNEIVIDSKISKVKRTRHVKMNDNLVSWLKPLVGKPIALGNHRYRVDELKKDLPWCSDILRHTCISFTMAVTKDIEKTAYQMGNSGAVIKAHYMQGVPEESVKRFWNLTPEIAAKVNEPAAV